MPVKVRDLVKAYDLLVKGINQRAKEDEDRAYGGIIRAGKGFLVESIAKHMVEIAWNDLKCSSDRLSFDRHSFKIQINEGYIERIKNPEIARYIRENITDYYYSLKTDIHVNIDNQFIVGIECKAYTENAMFKRIIVDFTLLKKIIPDLICVLIQLESQLTGDYSSPQKRIIYGSHSTHTILSYFDIDLNIITLLEGERRVKEPIHKSEYYKELKERNLLQGILTLKDILKEFR